MILFQRANVLDLERSQNERINEYVSALEFQPGDEAALVPAIIEQFRISEPELALQSELEPVSKSERLVEDEGRYARVPGPQRYKVLDVAYQIEVNGNPELLDFSPQNLAFSFSGSSPERRGSTITLNYTMAIDGDPSHVATRVASDVKMLRQNVAALQQWAASWNASLESRIKAALARRTIELQRRNQITPNLKIKIDP